MAIDVELDGFSGPLDLLCHLVESREIEAASISVSELVRAYSVFLQDTRRVPINTLAEFMALAARLLVGKLMALFPVPVIEGDEQEAVDADFDDEDLMVALRRYRPYRNAARALADLQRHRERHFSRSPEEGPALFDLGDLYSLSFFWWQLSQSHSHQFYGADETGWGDDDAIEGVPDAIPDEVQVDRRMEDLRETLSSGRTVSLRDLVGPAGGKPLLIVTFLALLELSRLGEVRILQKEVLGHVQLEIACSVVPA